MPGELDDEEFEYLTLYHGCERGRPIGLGPARIPPSEIAAYLDLLLIFDAERRRDIADVAMALDDVRFDWAASRVKVRKNAGS